jgi:hypothetical protein
VSPVPANFRRGVLPNFQETFFLWRIAKGGPECPGGRPGDSVMPEWERFLNGRGSPPLSLPTPAIGRARTTRRRWAQRASDRDDGPQDDALAHRGPRAGRAATRPRRRPRHRRPAWGRRNSTLSTAPSAMAKGDGRGRRRVPAAATATSPGSRSAPRRGGAADDGRLGTSSKLGCRTWHAGVYANQRPGAHQSPTT